MQVKAFFSSLVVAVIVAVGAMYMLDTSLQQQSDQAFTSPTGARMPSHGMTHNLVGKDWYVASEH
jgi:hypothetical protein